MRVSTPARIRTWDLRFRKPPLYPPELRGHMPICVGVSRLHPNRRLVFTTLFATLIHRRVEEPVVGSKLPRSVSGRTGRRQPGRIAQGGWRHAERFYSKAWVSKSSRSAGQTALRIPL